MTKKRRPKAIVPVSEEAVVRWESPRTIWLRQDIGLRKTSLSAEGFLSGRRLDWLRHVPLIYECEPKLYPLEFDRYIQPALNREVWDQFDEQYAIAVDVYGEKDAKLLPRPRCPLEYKWLGEFPKLSIDLIAEHVYPRLDPMTGSVLVDDWRQFIVEKADVDVALSELSTFQRGIADDALGGYTLYEISNRNRLTTLETVAELRTLNTFIKDRSAQAKEPKRESKRARCETTECGLEATHQKNCYDHATSMPRPKLFKTPTEQAAEYRAWAIEARRARDAAPTREELEDARADALALEREEAERDAALTWGDQRIGGTDPVRFLQGQV
jgi:hypothetical protein